MSLKTTLEHLAGSVGATRLRPGFAWTGELDLLWACGFPDLVYLTDESPKKGPVAWFREREPLGLPCGAWPAEVAHLLVHAADRATREHLSPKLSEAKAGTAALLAEAGGLPPPDEEVQLRVLRKLLGESYPYFGNQRRVRLVYALESLGGSEWIVSAALEYLESLSPEALNESNNHAVATVNALRPVLWRLSPGARASTQERIATLFQLAKDAWPHGVFARNPTLSTSHYVIAALDAILHGAEAVIGYRHRNAWLVALTQDAAFLAGFFTALKGEKWTTVGASAAFVAKDAVLNAFTHGWDEYTQKSDQLEMVLALPTIADDRILPWMMQMAAGSKVKGDAKKWFIANVDIAGDYVRDIATDGSHPHNAWAKKTAKAMKL